MTQQLFAEYPLIFSEQYIDYFLVFIFLVIFICFSTPDLLAVERETPQDETTLDTTTNSINALYLQKALEKYLGTPYRRGGASEKGFDCSGFVRLAYQELFGIDLPHGSAAQHNLSSMKEVSEDKLESGDLIFFTTVSNKKKVNHVGIYLSEGLFIHAAKQGVIISSLESSYWKSRFNTARRVADRDIWQGAYIAEGRGSTLRDIYHNDLFGFNDPTTSNLFSIGSNITWNVTAAENIPSFQITYSYEYPVLAVSSGILSSFSLHEDNNIALPFRSLATKGIRFAVDIIDNENLRFTPSLEYFDYGSDVYNNNQPRLFYGFNMAITPQNRDWLFYLGMQYNEPPRSIKNRYTDNDLSWPVDISMTYSHRLSEAASISFTGEMFSKYRFNSVESTIDTFKKNELRSSILFNWNY